MANEFKHSRNEIPVTVSWEGDVLHKENNVAKITFGHGKLNLTECPELELNWKAFSIWQRLKFIYDLIFRGNATLEYDEKTKRLHRMFEKLDNAESSSSYNSLYGSN